MFEAAVEKILGPMMCEYVENFSRQNLKIGLWSGHVQIKQVTLKKDIVKKLNLPFKIKYSRLGNLTMNIPWKSLASSKTQIIIEGLQILINEVEESKWEIKNTRIIEQRKKQIQDYCEKVINDFASKAANKGKSLQQQGYFSKIITKIIDNLQVTIKNIHFRYQDELTKQYAFGVTLQKLEMFTVNQNDQPQFIDRNASKFKDQPLRKRLILSNFGFYWNQQAQFFKQQQIKQKMISTIANQQNKGETQLNYVILMTSKAKLFQRDSGKQFVDPQIQLEIQFNQLKLQIMNMQLQQIVTMGQRLQKFTQQVKSANRQKMAKDQALKNRQTMIKTFIKIYQNQPVSQKQINQYQNILQKMQTINFTQKIKEYLQGKQKQKLMSQKRQKSRGWFSGPKQLTEQQKKQIENFLNDNFGQEIKVVKRPQEYFYIFLSLRLKKLQIAIASNSNKDKSWLKHSYNQGIRLQLFDINIGFQLRENGYKLKFEMDDIKVNLFSQVKNQKNQLINQQITQFLKKYDLISSQSNTQKSKKYIDMIVEGNPLGKPNIDTDIKVMTHQLLIIFDPKIIKIGKDFADIKISQNNTQAAFQTFGDLKQKTTNAVNSSLQTVKKKFIAIDIWINAITLVLYADPANKQGNCWEINMGKTTIYSDQQTLKKPNYLPNQPMQKYGLSFSQFSLAYFDSKKSLIQHHNLKNRNDSKFIQRLFNDLSLDLGLQVFEKGTKQIPKFRILTKLHTLNISFNKSSYSNLLKMGNSFAIPNQQTKLKQQKQIEKAKEKSDVMKNSRKIGMVFLKQLTGWKKYIAIYSGNFIYFYADKKDTQYTDTVFTKSALLQTEQVGSGNDKGKPFILKITTKLSSIQMGYDQKQLMEDWRKIISQTNKIDNSLVSTILDFAQEENKQSKAIQQINNKNIDHDCMFLEVFAQIQQIAVHVQLQNDKNIIVSVTKLQANVKLHQSKVLIKASLKYIRIKDNIYTYKMQNLTNFLYTVQNQDYQKLVDIDIKQLSNKHPQYDFVDAYINVSFGVLVCNFKTQTVSSLMKFFIPPPAPKQDIIIKQKKIMAQSQISKINQNLNKNLNQNIKQDDNQMMFGILAHLCQQKQVFSMKVNIVIQQISVSLINQKTKGLIGGMSILGFGMQFCQSNKRMLLKGYLGQIVYKDYSGFPKTIIIQQQNYDEQQIYLMKMNRQNKRIQNQNKQKNANDELKNNPILTFDIQMLQKPKPTSHKTMFIDVTLKDLEIYYFQQPVLRLITYLNTQMLPSLIPNSNNLEIQQENKEKMSQQQKQKKIKQKKLSTVIDDPPKKNPMLLKTHLKNISVILQPEIKKDQQKRQLMRLTIQQIGVSNDTLMKKYIKDYIEGQEMIMVDNYLVQLKSLAIYAQYSKKGKNTQLRAVTNKMDMTVSADLIQNTHYYYKTYGQRYQSGMRVNCLMTPFIMRINHDDYNFIMKCVNWCVSFDDRAEFYLYDIPDSIEIPSYNQQQNSQKLSNSSQPMYVDLMLKQISLAVTSSNGTPVSLLALYQLKLKYTMHSKGNDMVLSIHKIAGTNLSGQLTQQQQKLNKQKYTDIIVQRGMFNAFGYKKIHQRNQIDSLQGLQHMFQQNQIFNAKQQNYPSIYIQMTMDTNIKINMKINQLKISVDIWHLLLLSKLAVLQQSAQPPKPYLELHPKAKKKLQQKQNESSQKSSSTGNIQMAIDLQNFMASVSDKQNLNLVVMQGCSAIKMKLIAKKPQQQIIKKAPKTSENFMQSANHVIELKNFYIYFCKITDIMKNRRQILKPVQISVTYDEFYSSHDGNVFLATEINIQVSKIIFEATIKDIIKINAIAQDNLTALNENSVDKQKEQAIAKLMKQISMDKIISDIIPERAIIDQGNQQLIREASKKIKQQIKSKTNLKTKLSPVQLTIVNDCNGNFMPVIKFIIQQSQPIFTSSLLKTQLSYNITFNLNFFNPRSSKWEPIIQKYQTNIIYLTVVTQFGPKNHIIIESSKIEQLNQLKFNISTQFITQLMETLQIAKRQKKSIQQKSDRDYIQVSPYIFQNVTNQVITIRRELNGIKSDFPLQPGYFGSVRLTQQREVLDFEIMKRLCRVSLQHYGLVKIPDIQYFIQFKVDRLNRFIRFMAPKILTNETSKPIYCRRYNFRQQKLQDVQIKVGHQIPLDNMKYFQCSLNQSTFSEKVDIKRADFKSKMRSSKNGKFILTLVRKTQVIKNANFDQFEIHSTLKIINCLPKDIKIQFKVNNQTKSTKQVHAQQSHQVFANQNINKMKFSISMHGFYWCQDFCYQPHRAGEQNTFTIRDLGSSTNYTTFKYIFDQNKQNQQKTLTIFCKGYILSQLSETIKVFGNLQRDQENKKQQKYYPLGGQFQKPQKNDQHKIVLIGFETGNKIRIGGKHIGYDFSKPIVIGGIGMSQNRVALQHVVDGKIMNLFTVLGVDISIKQMNKASQIFSRQIVLKNRSIVINNTNKKLFMKQQGSGYYLFEVAPNQKKSFFFTMPQINENNKIRGIVIRGQDTSQCIPINMSGLGLLYFRLRQQNGSDSFFKISITQLKNYIFYEVSSIDKNGLPYQISVKSDDIEAYIPIFDVKVDSWNKFFYLNEDTNKQLSFGVQIKHKLSRQSKSVIVKPDNLNFCQKVKLQLQTGQLSGSCFIKISTMISDNKKFLVISLAKQKDNEDIKQFEIQEINIKLQKISFSFIHNHLTVKRPFQSFYFYLHNLQYISLKTNKFTKHQIKLQFLQLDQSQPYVLMNPVVITPYKYKQFMQPQKNKSPKSIFNCLVVMDNTFVQNVFINQLKIQFNDIVLKISQDFIKLSLQLSQQLQDVMNTHQQDFFISKKTNQWRQLQIPKQGSKTFIKSIKIAPFVIQISAELKLNKKDTNTHQLLFLGTFLNAIGVVMTNIDGAPITLYGVQIIDIVDTLDGIQAKLIDHYKHGVINQFYKIFGSLNIIGNPVSLFRNVSTGFRDFAEKPAQGLVQGPLQFGKGLAQGTSSLISHSVGGALNSLQKITGTISSGLAVLAFDQQYQQRRQQAKMKKPKHIFEGLQKGGKAVFYGFRDGVTGVFTKPFQGTKKEGAKGFFKGVAKGFTGLIVKPVSGIFDGASKTTQGLKNTALYLQDKPNENRVRYPRVFYTQCYTLRDYEADESKLNFVLHKSKYMQENSDSYFINSYLSDLNEALFIVLTRKHILLVDANNEKVLSENEVSNSRIKQHVAKGIPGILVINQRQRNRQQFLRMPINEDAQNLIQMLETLQNEYN